MAAEMNSADSPLKTSGNIELDEEEAFHNAADSFSTDEDNLAPADPSLDLEEAEGDFQEVENRPLDGRERDDVKTQVEEAPATVVEKPSIGRIETQLDEAPATVVEKPSIGSIETQLDEAPATVVEKPLIGRIDGKMKQVKRSSRRSSNGKKSGAAIISSKEEEEYGGKRRVYSREEMMGMRFFGVVQQKRLWRDIYNGLGNAAAEYASLVDHAIPKNPKHHPPRIINNSNPPSLGILGGAIPYNGATSPYNVIVQPYYPTMMKTCYSPDWAPYVNYGF